MPESSAPKTPDQQGQDFVTSALAIAAGTTAYFGMVAPTQAAAVRYENGGGDFFWSYTTLDLTKPANMQTYESSSQADGTSVYLRYFSDFYPSFSYTHSYATGPGAEVWSSGFLNRYAVAFNAGDAIGSNLSNGEWNQGTDFAFSFESCSIDVYYIPYEYCDPYGYCNTYYYGPYYNYDCSTGERGLIPNDGTQHYVGVKLDIGGMTHYGWIGLTNSFGYITPFAWGYETTPNTAIAAGAPTPSTLAGLAMGAAAFGGRKRRDA